MGNNFFAYLQQLELMAFFSGYCLLYAIIIVFAESNAPRNNFKNRIILVLPLSYALVATLFLGLQVRNFYSSLNTGVAIHHPFLMIWALLAILFWIPAFRKKEWFSLLHSLLFFFMLVKDVIVQIFSSQYIEILKNDMKIYTVSLLLNLATFIVMLVFSFVVWQNKKSEKY